MKLKGKNYSIRVVEYALDILEQFLGNGGEFGVSELSRRLKLRKNNVFRLLATLESCQFIEQNKISGNYRLGLKNLEIGQIFIKQMSIHRRSKPVLEALVRECNETSELAILRGDKAIFCDAVESSHLVRVVPRIGINAHANCTAAGKVILANLAEKEVNSTSSIEELRKYIPKNATKLVEFERNLKEIVEQGFAIEDEGLDSEARSVAAPIYNYARCVVGAISVSGPISRFSRARIHDELAPLVKRAAEEISLRFGYQ